MALFALLLAAAVAAMVAAQDPETAVIRSAVPWFDTDGNRMYAGGANVYLEDGYYYLVGEGKKVLGADCSACFNLYRSQDLQTWENRGCVLNNSAIVAPPPFDKESFYRMERPKIFKCPGGDQTAPYRMWFHCDTSGFAMRSVGVLTAANVEGPYTFASPCFRPDGQDSYDMGTYWDDPSMPGGDGRVYLIRSVMNQFAGISQMTDDCLNTTGIISQGPDMEGQAIMRDGNGTLHAAGSHLTGWAANAAQFVTSPNASLVGALWQNNYNPSGDATTYNSQSTFLFPYRHKDGHVTHIWMADRWNANGPGGLDNMTLIWLPLVPPTSNGTGPVNPSAGWILQLAPCNGQDPLQQFTVQASGQMVHSSGLCVAQPAPSEPSGAPLVLAACGGAGQSWYYPGDGSIASTASGSGAGCVHMNNANQVLPAGNPVIDWPCGGGPAWNELWVQPLPKVGVAGTFQARAQSGGASGMCVSVAPTSNPGDWTLPWYDAWSLKDF